MKINFIKLNENAFYNKGFTLVLSEENKVVYDNDNVRMIVELDGFTYELNVAFELKKEKVSINIKDAANYYKLNDMLYQISSKEQFENGERYIYKAIITVLNKMGDDIESCVKKIYDFRKDRQKAELNEYYQISDLKKADELWNDKKFEKALEIYQRNVNRLSKVQLKKMDYIKKHHNK